jgi:nucleolar complex protein 2
MAKQTKRQRKFQATGGVNKRIEKGTISRKGNPNRKHRTSGSKTDPSKDPLTSLQKQQQKQSENNELTLNRSDDLLGNENLGDLDVDRFFAQFTSEQQAHGDDDDDADSLNDNDNDIADNDGKTLEQDDGVEDDDDGVAEMKESSEKDMDGDNDESDVNDSDDDEDIEVMETRMKKQMSKMQRSDPEFHDFLKENEQSLLDFGNDEDPDDEDDDDPNTDEDLILQQQTEKKDDDLSGGGTSIPLTPQLLKVMIKGTFQAHGLKSLKKIVGAFKSACYISADTTNVKKNETSNSYGPGDSKQLYVIESSKVFDELMLICFNSVHKEFKYHLLEAQDDVTQKAGSDSNEEKDSGSKSEQAQNKNERDDCNKPLHPKLLEKSSRWVDMKPILLSFFRSTLRLLSEAKEPELLSFVVKSLSNYVQYMTPFPRVADLMLKALVGLWSAPIDTLETYQVVRLNAFLRIRQLSLTQPFPFIEECLKKTYLAYMKRAKFGSTAINSPALPTLTFMGNCLVELYSLDFHSSYQHAFVYIRQLALLLRSAMQKKTIETMQQVYCWQYVQCLKLWVAVLSAAVQTNDGTNMKSLIYPLIEVIMGTIRFIPSPVRHLPYRFHCVRLLQQIAASTELFIPTASILLDCLDWKEWVLVPKKTKVTNRATTRGTQFHLMLKFGKEDPLRTHDQLEAGINEFFVLLHREIDLYRFSAGFPEYVIRIMVRLRQFMKDVRNPRWRTYIKACIDHCSTCTTYAVNGRSKLQQSPRDVKQLECLRPKSEKTMLERYNDSISKEQTSLDAANASFNHTNNKKMEAEDAANSSDEEQHMKSKASTKKRRKKGSPSGAKRQSAEEIQENMLDDDQLMKEVDRVQDGVNWSDDEDE